MTKALAAALILGLMLTWLVPSGEASAHCKPQSPPTSGMALVWGEVITDAFIDTKGLQGADVSLSGETVARTTTDSSGCWSISVFPSSGSFMVLVGKTGYNGYSDTAFFNEPTTYQVQTIEMQAANAAGRAEAIRTTTLWLAGLAIAAALGYLAWYYWKKTAPTRAVAASKRAEQRRYLADSKAQALATQLEIERLRAAKQPAPTAALNYPAAAPDPAPEAPEPSVAPAMRVNWTSIVLLVFFLATLLFAGWYWLHLQNDCIPPSQIVESYRDGNIVYKGEDWEFWKYKCP